MIENYDRWVFATMSGDFNATFTADTQVFVEGSDRERPVDVEYVEFRMDGPRKRQPSRIDIRYEFEINILVRTYMDSKNFHRMRDLCGRVREWLDKNHCIYRHGTGPDDNPSLLLGELHLVNRRSFEAIRTNNFGQIDPKYRIEESTVEASFVLHI